jgi:hypothetical protein
VIFGGQLTIYLAKVFLGRYPGIGSHQADQPKCGGVGDKKNQRDQPILTNTRNTMENGENIKNCSASLSQSCHEMVRHNFISYVRKRR